MKVTYMRVFYPGLFFAGHSDVKVADRSVVELPKGSFGYRFFEREETELNGKLLVGPSENFSGLHTQGEVLTLEEIKQKLPKTRDNLTLISNLECNGFKKAVRTIMGNWQYFQDGDVLLPTQHQVAGE